MSEEEQSRLKQLFHAYDEDNSGRIEKNEFSVICREIHVPSQEVDKVFSRLDVDGDGSVTLEEFISGFKERLEEGREAEDKRPTSSEREASDRELQLISG